MAEKDNISPKPSGILALDPDKLHEINGVVLDKESYERHFTAPAAAAPEVSAGPQAPADPAPAPLGDPTQGAFPCEPMHIGWYQTEGAHVAYPIMGGFAFHPCGSGSFSSSFATSYYVTSGSWLYGSGSWLYGSGSFSGGGYGLELI